MHCRRSELHLLAPARLGLRLVDQEMHRERRRLLLERAQHVRHLLGNRPRPTLIASRFGMESLEAASAIRGQPLAEGLRRHAATPRAGNLVYLLRFLAGQGVESTLTLLSIRQVGDQAIPEERDPL